MANAVALTKDRRLWRRAFLALGRTPAVTAQTRECGRACAPHAELRSVRPTQQKSSRRKKWTPCAQHSNLHPQRAPLTGGGWSKMGFSAWKGNLSKMPHPSYTAQLLAPVASLVRRDPREPALLKYPFYF